MELDQRFCHTVNLLAIRSSEPILNTERVNGLAFLAHHVFDALQFKFDYFLLAFY